MRAQTILFLLVDGVRGKLNCRPYRGREEGNPKKLVEAASRAFPTCSIILTIRDPPTLTTKQNQPAGLYATVLLPALSVDQDHGWTTDYWTPANRNFIQDQRQEVIRFLVGLPPRHAFRARTEFDAAKDSLERTDRAIDMQRFIVERLRTNEQLSDNEEPVLAERRTRLRSELEANSAAIEAIRSVTAFYDREIAALETQRNELAGRVGALNKQKGQLSLVLSELDGEEDILTANVQSTDLLRQFCGREGCQMFATSERSFGRSLLFLKDQIKDLKASDRGLSRDVEATGQQIARLEAALEVKRSERDRAVNASPQAEVMGKLNTLTKERRYNFFGTTTGLCLVSDNGYTAAR